MLRFDNRGAGQDSAPDEPYSMRQMADDAAALLGALGIEKAHVLGVSMGGMIAQELAINHPDRVDKLVLACTRAKPTGARRLAAEVQRVTRLADLGPREREAYGMPWGMTATFMQDQRRVDERIELAAEDPYPMQAHAYIRQLEATMAHDTLDRLARDPRRDDGDRRRGGHPHAAVGERRADVKRIPNATLRNAAARRPRIHAGVRRRVQRCGDRLPGFVSGARYSSTWTSSSLRLRMRETLSAPIDTP